MDERQRKRLTGKVRNTYDRAKEILMIKANDLNDSHYERSYRQEVLCEINLDFVDFDENLEFINDHKAYPAALKRKIKTNLNKLKTAYENLTGDIRKESEKCDKDSCKEAEKEIKKIEKQIAQLNKDQEKLIDDIEFMDCDEDAKKILSTIPSVEDLIKSLK